MKIVLTMSTVPNRMDRVLKESVTRILDMPEEFELHLNIPDIFASTKEEYIIPEWLSSLSHPKLKLFKGVKDLGPRTKLIPTLERITDPDTIVITVDDDVIYCDGMISYHLKMRDKYPDAAIGFAGVGGNARYYTCVARDVKVAVLENYKTTSYKRSFFGDDFFKDYLDKSWNDDIIASAYLRDKKIPRIIPRWDKETNFSFRVVSFPIVRLVPTEFGGCDHFRGSSNKNTFQENLDAYKNCHP